jgi:hypothetical protein
MQNKTASQTKTRLESTKVFVLGPATISPRISVGISGRSKSYTAKKQPPCATATM